ncbi:hypothetical protein KIW84_042432 [Lathyrus oleraceus]|uniref:Uncharacterized protein n=1 Tax=Pisum sativum TaxID=3888 RepID=A0A9D4XAX9_PEA|nr:hypothetical protein KIW84_042432 [Pisum sativum]
MPYRLIALTSIPALIPQYQALQPQYEVITTNVEASQALELIYQKILSFVDVLIVGNNTLPKHGGSGVNVICVEFKVCLQHLIDQLVIQFTRARIDKVVVVVVPVFDQERLLKPLVVPYQRSANPTPMKKIEPNVIHVSTSFSVNSTKAVP